MKKIFTLLMTFLTFSTLIYAGSGTESDPYSCAELIAVGKDVPAGTYVIGYIVGGRYDDFDYNSNVFGISIADSKAETEVKNCVQVKLASALRDSWHPKNNAARIGQMVIVSGGGDGYGGYPALENDVTIEEYTPAGGDARPSVSEITTDPIDIASTDAVTISATVTDDSGVKSVVLNWGLASDALSNQIAMSNTGDVYTAASAIPAQANGTMVYYSIVATDDADQVNTIIGNYTVEDPATPQTTVIPYEETFTEGFGMCYTYSVSGDTKEWASFSELVSMNGYNGANPEEDWLVLPGINLDMYSNEVITFTTYAKYGTNDDNNYLKLMYSTDYSGVGNPGAATWNELTYAQPEGITSAEELSAPSGNIDLSSITGTKVYLAFKYYSTDAPTNWKVDDIKIVEASGTPTISVEVDSLSGFGYEENDGANTMVKSTLVSGLSLESDITVTAPTNFEVSLDNSAYSTSVTTPQSGDATMVYVRLASGLAINSYSGDLILSSTNAVNDTINLSGEVIAPVVLPNAWINEFHYDNSATADGDEFVEIIADVSTYSDVTKFRIDLYNGNNGSSYENVTGADLVFETGDDFKIFTWRPSSIQNGNDAIALSYSGKLIQFISYEGEFVASDGVAMGVEAVNLEVEESNADEDGLSLQLTGSGLKYSDFVWQGPVAATAGALNAGQAIGYVSSSNLVSMELNRSIYGITKQIVIRSAENDNFTVYNLTGRVVKTGLVSNGETFVNVKSGIYIVKVNNTLKKVLVR